MTDGLIFALLFGGAFLLWVGTLGLFWMVFRSWQWVMDAMSRCPAAILRRLGLPVVSPFDEDATDDIPRTRVMALQARVFVFDLPGDCPDDARAYARQFRRCVLALTALMCGICVLVVWLEPAFLIVGQVFLGVLLAWALLHVALLWRWRLWPGQQVADA